MPNPVFKLPAILFLCIITLHVYSQSSDYQFQKIAPEALRKDFLLLKDTIQKIHPGLYRYQSKSAINYVFDSCYMAIKDSMTVPEFYLLTRFVIASVNDGHTNCRLSDEIRNQYINSEKVVPAMVFFIHKKAFIFCAKQNDSLAESEILSIDNHKMDEIVARLFTYIPSDGNIESRKNWELPEYFQMLYNLVYGEREIYHIVYKTKAGEIRSTILHADFIKNIICAHPFSRPDKYLQLSYTANNIAVLTLKSFFDGFLAQTKENFKQFLDSAFNDIREKKSTRLLIDVRSNQGGNDENGILLYSWLTANPFIYYSSQENVTRKFSENERANPGIKQSKEKNFSGKVYVLMNGRSFSGTAEFCSIFKTNSRGLLIGEECGGGYYGNTSGDEIHLLLPNTKISVRIPMIKYTMAVQKLNKNEVGILPDFPFYQTISDLADKNDNQLKYALKIANEK
jgi:hypothetical protein